MTGSPDDDYSELVSKALGVQMRRRRDYLKLTRQDVVDRTWHTETSVQSLLNYESGIRRPTVAKFVALCRALEAHPPTMLQLALQDIDAELDKILIDIGRIAQDKRGGIPGLHQWAIAQLANDPTEVTVLLDRTRVSDIAACLGISVSALRETLYTYAPNVDVPS